MKRIMTTAAALLIAGQAGAVTLTTVNDFDLSGEVAVGEIRAGNVGTERELGINAPDGTNLEAGSVEGLLADGDYSFTFGFAAATNTLSIVFAGLGLQTTAFDFGGADTLVLRAYGRPGNDTRFDASTTLSGLTLNGTPLDGTVAGVGGADLAVVDGFDFSEDFTLEGTISFDGIDEGGRRSQLAAQFKVVDVAPIPLPAAGWLLIAGLGGLAAMRRRKA